MKTFNIIGAGRLGKTLARLARDSGAYRIGAVLCRTPEAAQAACDFIGGGVPLTELAMLPAADLTLLAVPDSQIAVVAKGLAAAGVVSRGSVLFHCSGAGEAALLMPLMQQGVVCASMHPAFSFADPARAVLGFAGTRCALEGDVAAFPLLNGLASVMGGQTFVLAPGGKAAYHAALSVASNYLVTLHDLASRIAQSAGVDAEASQALLGDLMRKTLENTLALGPAAALTGPVLRGDAGTLQQHRRVLGAQDDVLYCALGMATLRLAEGRLDATAVNAVVAALGGDQKG